MNHRHVLAFDPFQIKREQISAKAVGHAVFKPGGRIFLISAKDPAAAFLAHI